MLYIGKSIKIPDATNDPASSCVINKGVDMNLDGKYNADRGTNTCSEIAIFVEI